MMTRWLIASLLLLSVACSDKSDGDKPSAGEPSAGVAAEGAQAAPAAGSDEAEWQATLKANRDRMAEIKKALQGDVDETERIILEEELRTLESLDAQFGKMSAEEFKKAAPAAQQMEQRRHETNMGIIDNMGATPQKDHYDQDGNYLGRW